MSVAAAAAASHYRRRALIHSVLLVERELHTLLLTQEVQLRRWRIGKRAETALGNVAVSSTCMQQQMMIRVRMYSVSPLYWSSIWPPRHGLQYLPWTPRIAALKPN